MNHHLCRLAAISALVAGIGGVGVARAELIEPAAPALWPIIKESRPVPLPSGRPGASSVVVHRVSPVTSQPRLTAHCAWFECGLLIVGMGF
jgi:hypothetical protein